MALSIIDIADDSANAEGKARFSDFLTDSGTKRRAASRGDTRGREEIREGQKEEDIDRE